MERGWGGRWRGWYLNPTSIRGNDDHEFGIEAHLEQWGGGITGSMTDLDPTHSVSLRAFAASDAAGTWLPRERQAVDRWLALYPEIVIQSHLPERSELVGSVKGNTIDFEKRYLGPMTTAWLDGERELARTKVSDHRVRYRGTMSEDGSSVAGTWTIQAPGIAGMLGKKVGDGEFRLIREP